MGRKGSFVESVVEELWMDMAPPLAPAFRIDPSAFIASIAGHRQKQAPWLQDAPCQSNHSGHGRNVLDHIHTKENIEWTLNFLKRAHHIDAQVLPRIGASCLGNV